MWPFRKKSIATTVTMRKTVTRMDSHADYFVNLTAPDDYVTLISHALGAIDSLENGIEVEENE